MKLRDYLSAERGRQAALARAIDAHAPDISDWAHGKRPVPVHMGPAIEEATDGAVTRKDLFPATWADIWPELMDSGKRRRSTDKSG